MLLPVLWSLSGGGQLNSTIAAARPPTLPGTGSNILLARCTKVSQMRFHVSGIPEGVGPGDLKARFDSLGGTVAVDVPAARSLGGSTIIRPFVYVEIQNVEDAKLLHFVRVVWPLQPSTACSTDSDSDQALSVGRQPWGDRPSSYNLQRG